MASCFSFLERHNGHHQTKTERCHLSCLWENKNRCFSCNFSLEMCGLPPIQGHSQQFVCDCLRVNEKHTHTELAKKLQPPCSLVFSMTLCHESVKVNRGHHQAQFEQSHLHSLQGKAIINCVFQGWLDELLSFQKPAWFLRTCQKIKTVEWRAKQNPRISIPDHTFTPRWIFHKINFLFTKTAAYHKSAQELVIIF